MNHLFRIVLATSPLLLCHCQSDGWCQFTVALNKAGYAFSQSQLGLLAGQEPDWNQQYTDCRQGIDSTDPPGIDEAAFTPHRPSSDICAASHDADDPCVACVLANCCTEVVACVGEYTCTCRLGRQTPGVDWPEEATCDTSDKVTDDAIACLSTHCADVCPRVK